MDVDHLPWKLGIDLKSGYNILKSSGVLGLGIEDGQENEGEAE